MKLKLSTLLIKQYIKLCLVGFSGSIVQFLSFNIFRNMMSASLAILFAILLAIVNNFYFHGRITFKKKGFVLADLFRRMGFIFVTYQSMMVFLQVEWLKWGILWTGSSRFHENLMMLVGMMWGSLINFMVYKHLIWKEEAH
jgi:putative flippase GtrA